MGDEKTMKHGRKRDKPGRIWRILFWVYVMAALMNCIVMIGVVGGAEWGRISIGETMLWIVVTAAAVGLFFMGAAACGELNWKEERK